MKPELPSTVGTDVEGVSKWVTLARAPASARWRKALKSEPGLGPTDWELLAVLEYGELDAAAVLSGLPPLPAAKEPFTPGEAAWLTPALATALESAARADASGLGKSPLATGWAARLPGSGTVVLRLSTR